MRLDQKLPHTRTKAINGNPLGCCRRELTRVFPHRTDALLQSGPHCCNSYLFLFSIQGSFFFFFFLFKWTALRVTGTKVCPWRHGPNSRESWQLLRIDGTLMDIKPHNGWIGKQKGVKEWWWKENVHSQRGTKREVCEWEMGESGGFWWEGGGARRLEGVVSGQE